MNDKRIFNVGDGIHLEYYMHSKILKINAATSWFFRTRNIELEIPLPSSRQKLFSIPSIRVDNRIISIGVTYYQESGYSASDRGNEILGIFIRFRNKSNRYFNIEFDKQYDMIVKESGKIFLPNNVKPPELVPA